MPAILWKLLPGLLVVGAFFIWLNFFHDPAIRQEVHDSYKLAAQAAEEESQKKIKQLEEQYNAQLQELLQKPDSGYGVGPFTSAVLDGMR